jgi:hypothetical protein
LLGPLTLECSETLSLYFERKMFAKALAVLVALAVHALGASVSISNVTPRRSGGIIMDAHDSRFQHKNGVYHW